MLEEATRQNALYEGNVRNAFDRLLRETAKVKKLELVTELSERRGGKRIAYDGVLRDVNRLPHGWWEAKDPDDDLENEIRKKRERGYRFDNIIFEDTRQAVLFQNGVEVMRGDLWKPEQVARLLTQFYNHEIPPFKEFNEAVKYFQGEIPHIAAGLKEKIDTAHQTNTRFQEAYANFLGLCQTAINPDLSPAAVDEMLIQHMLTERLIRKIFNVEEFTRRNVIASEVETVIDALSSNHFNRREFLGSLDRFYTAIENAADRLATFTEKQNFLNRVYERFFRGYSVKVADTHGIVYTPQPIVDFMCAAVEEVLDKEFGKRLGDPGVTLVDPATGTGNYAVNLLRRAAERNTRNFERFYREQLFANEVMLMPYYIASLNIEQEYFALAGRYEPFEGMCFVDTLDLAEEDQMHFEFMTQKNTERVERQKKMPITVVIGNPPYNVGQLNENDNNKNRKYKVVDSRIAQTYGKDSKASSKTKLNDAYVKFFRWAVDRLGDRDGIVCYVSNNSFVDQIAFDGMRKHLLQDFTTIYHLDLHGNVRQNPKLSGTTHNVFGIQVGVGITVAIRKRSTNQGPARVFYHRVPEDWTRKQKLDWLDENVERLGRWNALNTVEWTELTPDAKGTWLIAENANEYASFIPLGTKETKASRSSKTESIFKLYSLGVSTNRDNVVYSFSKSSLESKVESFISAYNAEVDRYRRAGGKAEVDSFVNYDTLKWSGTLKLHLARGKYAKFDHNGIRISAYRPFSKRYLYYDAMLNERPREFSRIFPTAEAENQNRILCVSGIGSSKPFHSLITNTIPCMDLNEKTQCFPFYSYDQDGGNQRENISDWALEQYRDHYADNSITKWDIFYYVYGLLHHPEYRARYADSLKRELPRIPFAQDFWAFSKAGRKLADLHLCYESIEPYELQWDMAMGKPISYRVEKMKLSKDKTSLQINDSLTLHGIPAKVFEYRLGNRSALEWVIDQYQVSTDKRSGITSDPNTYAPHDPRYIVDLVERIVRVSLETVSIVEELQSLPFRGEGDGLKTDTVA